MPQKMAAIKKSWNESIKEVNVLTAQGRNPEDKTIMSKMKALEDTKNINSDNEKKQIQE